MDGLLNLIALIKEHYAEILVGVALVFGIAYTVYDFLTKNKGRVKEATIELAKKQVKLIALKLVSDAEEEWGSDTGKIKRSQVIEAIFDRYPILRQVTDQDALIEWIDEIIDQALIEMHEILDETLSIEALEENEKKLEKTE